MAGPLGFTKKSSHSIISSVYSATYNASKHLTTIPAPMVRNTPHYIKNSDFTNKVHKLGLHQIKEDGQETRSDINEGETEGQRKDIVM